MFHSQAPTCSPLMRIPRCLEVEILNQLLLRATADVFAFALTVGGIAKLRDSIGFRSLLARYGALPPGWAGPLAKLIPVTEILLAFGLVLPAIRQMAGAATALFLLGAAAVIGASLVAGSVPERCGCFGANHGSAPTWRTVARAGAAALLVGAITLDAATLPTSWTLEFLAVGLGATAFAFWWSASFVSRAIRPG